MLTPDEKRERAKASKRRYLSSEHGKAKTKEYERTRYAENRNGIRDRILAGRRAAYANNPGVREDRILRAKAAYDAAPEKAKEYVKLWRTVKNPDRFYSSYIKRKFGLSWEEYQDLIKRQNNKCAICALPQENKRLAIDHCHATGDVRGLLCDKCNRGLGLFGDSIERLRAAIAYLDGENK